MKSSYIIGYVFILGCSANSANGSVAAQDAAIRDAISSDTTVQQDSGLSVSVDANNSDDTGLPYDPCIHSWTSPLTSGSPQAMKCLTIHFCTDSDGQTYTDYFIDSCQDPPGTQIPCKFSTSCYDSLQYCLPTNDQGFNREYEGDTCSIKVGLVGIDLRGNPASDYIGEEACIAADGGMATPYDCLSIENGTMPFCKAIYTRGNKFVTLSPDCPLSYRQYDIDGTSQCFCEGPGVPNANWYIMKMPALVPVGLFVPNCDPVSGVCASW